MPITRPSAVAGMFYPAESLALQTEIGALLRGALPQPSASPPKALIVPHAGYVYSGPVAASAYALLAPLRNRVHRVLLLGPTHRLAVRGLALPDCDAFATPLGSVPVDKSAEAAIAHLPQVIRNTATHAQEHSLEVQLPFLQETLEEFSLGPLAVGAASAGEVAEVLERLWGGPETLIVISSDLSHYHPYPMARSLDQASADCILDMDPVLDHEQACGATPINGLLLAARRHGLRPRLLDMRNSGDTAGDKGWVVGYASFAFSEEHVHA